VFRELPSLAESATSHADSLVITRVDSNLSHHSCNLTVNHQSTAFCIGTVFPCAIGTLFNSSEPGRVHELHLSQRAKSGWSANQNVDTIQFLVGGLVRPMQFFRQCEG
jgi:hypothetical protein